MIMIEMQYSGTGLLLLVNPRIPHKNNGTAHPIYVFIDASLPAMFNPLYRITNLKRTSAIKVAIMKITDNFHYE